VSTELEAYCRAREEVLAAVRRLLIESLDLRRPAEEIDPDTALFGTGLGLDSVDAVEIVIALETDLGVKLSDDRQRRRALRSVNAIVDAVMAARARVPDGEVRP
jgi:acyl carrier protein